MLIDAFYPFAPINQYAPLEYDLIDDTRLYDQHIWIRVIIIQDANFQVLDGNSFGATKITWPVGTVLGGKFTAIQLSKGVISACRDAIAPANEYRC